MKSNEIAPETVKNSPPTRITAQDFRLYKRVNCDGKKGEGGIGQNGVTKDIKKRILNMSLNHLNAPFESPLEEMFALNMEKYINETIDLQNQIEIETICGNFRLDFLISHGNRKIAFECDGLQYHDPSRDEWRDAMILGAKTIDAIYRLRGADLTYHIEDCLYLVSKWESNIFSHRGKLNLETLASKEAINHPLVQTDSSATIVYWDQSQNLNNPLLISIHRHSFETLPGNRNFLKRIFEFAQKHGGGNLERIVADFRKGWRDKSPAF